MKMGKEFRTKALSNSPQFGYLPEEDRYLIAGSQPKFKFNVIGAGNNGQEHINVTYLEGRATIHGVFDPNPRSIAVAHDIQGRLGLRKNWLYMTRLRQLAMTLMSDALLILYPKLYPFGFGKGGCSIREAYPARKTDCDNGARFI